MKFSNNLSLFSDFSLPASPRIIAFQFGTEPINFGESASVQCLVTTGDFPISFQWFFNGRRINDAIYDISIVKLGKKISALSIDVVRAHHAGNYTCMATNFAASVNHSAELIVNGIRIYQN